VANTLARQSAKGKASKVNHKREKGRGGGEEVIGQRGHTERKKIKLVKNKKGATTQEKNFTRLCETQKKCWSNKKEFPCGPEEGEEERTRGQAQLCGGTGPGKILTGFGEQKTDKFVYPRRCSGVKQSLPRKVTQRKELGKINSSDNELQGLPNNRKKEKERRERLVTPQPGQGRDTKSHHGPSARRGGAKG